MPKCILAEQGKSNGSSITLLSIEITTAPTKTSYLAGDTFDTSGMVVTASYGLGDTGAAFSTAAVSGYVVSPSTLSDGDTYVTISYTEAGTTVTTIQAVTVSAKLTSIAMSSNPTTTTYEYGDTLSTSGASVTASYSDGSTKTVTATYSPTSLTTVGTQTITVSYTENGVTCTTSFTVTVTRKSVSTPTWSGSLTYTGSSQSVTSTSYWTNYNTTYMTIGGTTSGTNAGTYTATFTPTSNYQWSDGTTTAVSVSWTISKATGSLSVSPTSVTLDASTTSATVTITRSGDGTISYSPTSVSGLTLSLSGTTLTIKGDGSTAVSTTITISVAAGTNYTAPSSKTISVTATYWSWGNDGDSVDKTWFAGLHNYLASNSASSDWVGDTKSVTLSSSVLGTTTHLIRCIDVNKDASNTVTFQTANCLATTSTFGSSAVWSSSSVRTYCQNYYNYFPGKDYILTVSKGTMPGTDTSTVTYSDETVFLPSLTEMGLTSTYAASEFTSGVSSAYSYYSSSSTRIKYLGDSGTSAQYYWSRSRYSNSSAYVWLIVTSGGGYGAYGSSSGVAPALVVG